MNRSLLLAYSAVKIPSNYISNLVSFTAVDETDGYYFCDVFSRIDAKDKSQAFSFEDQINDDPDSVSRSKFAAFLDEILEADEFDISMIDFDIVEVEESSSGGGSDTTEIIVWFLGVSAVCAVGALLLIVCWRKFGAVDDSEMDNGINLEFLLDPNGGGAANENIFTSPMHIEPDGAAEEEEAQQYHSMQPDMEGDSDDMEEVVPIRKKKAKIKYFSRLDDGNTGKAGGSADAGNDGDVDLMNLQTEEQYEDEETDEEDDQANPLMDDYNPPNFSRI